MVHLSSLLALSCAAIAVSSAPTSLDDRPELILARQFSNSSGELGPSTVYSSPPTIVVLKVKDVQVGPRPYYLVSNMTDSPLKEHLESCSEDPLHPTQFSISHRGAALQFPEHTREGIIAAVRMGAGVVECDVSFTSDRQLVCRHLQCDLYSATNILTIPELASKCNATFTSAQGQEPANASCCTSDITLDEFESLCGKQKGFNTSAVTPRILWEYTPLVDSYGPSFTTEAKEPVVAMPFQGEYTQEQYLDQIVNEFEEADIHPSRVWMQSFRLSDVVHWEMASPDLGRQSIYLDERTDTPEGLANATACMKDFAAKGVKIIAPALAS